MHRLLYPAMRLMNRLSFSLKFSLISAVFFLPLIGLSGFLALESYRQLAYGQHERASLKPLSDVLSLLGKVERLHVQVQIQTALGQGAAGDELRHQSERLKSEIVERLQALQPVSSEANAFKEFQEKRQALLETAAELQQPAMGIGETARVARLLTQQEVFVKFVAAQAGLLLDGQREVRQVVELLIGLLPEVSRLLGEGEALGSTALIKGFVSSNENDRLNNLLVVLEKNQSDYALGLAEANLGATALQAVAQDSQLALRKGLEFLTQSVVEAASLNMPWQQFQRDYGHAQEQLQRFGGASLEFLDEQLQRRLNEKRRQLASLVGGLLLVMLLIAFLYGGFFLATRSALQNLAEMLGRVADGDMTAHVRVDSRDELGELGRAFNVTVAKIHDLIERVGHTVTEVESQARRVERVSGESNQAVAGQRGQIEQIATAMNQMSSTSQEVARSAAAAVDSAQCVNQETVGGRALVESQVGSIQQLAGEIDQSVLVINQLASDSASISRVLDVIKGIAEQTNLLALNAAIEAARAGEQGRGFAVVADEVRNLARRTQQSTEEIEQMIVKLQGGVGAAVKAMNASHQMVDGTVDQSSKVQQALENILSSVGAIVDQNQQIAAAAEQQTAVAHDIDQNIVEINHAGERTAEGASQTEQASRELAKQAGHLKQLTAAFRLTS